MASTTTVAAATAKISQKEYLKKYLSNDADTDAGKAKKKKKAKSAAKKVAAAARANVRIIDDDVDIGRLRRFDDHDLEAYAIGEEAPQIVGVLDDRPAELIATEDYTHSDNWKVLRTVDGALAVQQLGADGRTLRGTGFVDDGAAEPAERRRFTRYDSDDEGDHNDQQQKRAAGRDQSPVRRPTKRAAANDPSRKQRRSRTPEKRRKASADRSPERRRRARAGSDSPAVRSRRRSASDTQSDDHRSPTTRRRRRNVSRSPARRIKAEHIDSDQSPVRRRNGRDSSPSPPRRIKAERVDSDQSPVRQRRGAAAADDDDASPPRRPRHRHDRSPEQSTSTSTRRHRQRSPDQSPPRRHRPSSVKAEPAAGKTKKLSRWSRDRSTQPPSSSGDAKMTRTLDGKAAGLQSAQAMRTESDRMREREARQFDAMSASASGRDAEAVVRDRRTGRVRDVDAEMAVEHEKIRKELERKAVYDRWGKGVKQLDEHQTKRADEQHEASKPVARYADDADRDALLRERTREDDPMLEYVRGKQSAQLAGKPARPLYRGAYPDTRYGIRPGYRWDGVDRSNGFEKRWFEVQSRSKAAEEETYKYMTEDM